MTQTVVVERRCLVGRRLGETRRRRRRRRTILLLVVGGKKWLHYNTVPAAMAPRGKRRTGRRKRGLNVALADAEWVIRERLSEGDVGCTAAKPYAAGRALKHADVFAGRGKALIRGVYLVRRITGAPGAAYIKN